MDMGLMPYHAEECAGLATEVRGISRYQPPIEFSAFPDGRKS